MMCDVDCSQTNESNCGNGNRADGTYRSLLRLIREPAYQDYEDSTTQIWSNSVQISFYRIDCDSVNVSRGWLKDIKVISYLLTMVGKKLLILAAAHP
jgi:hypothetical protein